MPIHADITESQQAGLCTDGNWSGLLISNELALWLQLRKRIEAKVGMILLRGLVVAA